MSGTDGQGNSSEDHDDQNLGNPGSPGGDGSQPGSDANPSPGVNNLFEGNSSLFFAQQPFPTTLALQGELFILRHDFIDEEMSIEFYEQAMKINDCMQKHAINLLNLKILTDPTYSMHDRRERHEWHTKLNKVQIATLIVQYFYPNGLGDGTLAESLGNVPFHYCLSNHDLENATFMRYIELVQN